jgi:hypothetical protein
LLLVFDERNGLMMAEKAIFDGKPVLQFRTNTDRRAFLKWAGLVGVGVTYVAGGMLGRPTAAEAAEITLSTKTARAGTDVDILNYALTLEYLEADFYATGLAKGFLSGRELELITPIGDHENQHVAAVTATVTALGGTPVAKPKITYPAGVFDTKESFFATASMFEELGVTAYHGQVPLIQSLDVLAAGASIAGVESRHAAVIATLIGGNPFPNPIEKNASMETILAAVTPLIS